MSRSESGYKVEKKADIAAANGAPAFSKIIDREHTEELSSKSRNLNGKVKRKYLYSSFEYSSSISRKRFFM